MIGDEIRIAAKIIIKKDEAWIYASGGGVAGGHMFSLNELSKRAEKEGEAEILIEKKIVSHIEGMDSIVEVKLKLKKR